MIKNTIGKRIVSLIVLLTIAYITLPATNTSAGLIDSASVNRDPDSVELSDATLKGANSHLKTRLIESSPSIISETSLASITSPMIGISLGKYRMLREMIVPATAYNSVPWQTDDTPFITANGSHVRWGTAAANFLPFGTKFRIPDLYGNTVFEIEDRMNSRYTYKVDIWFADYDDALEFGARNIRIEILEA